MSANADSGYLIVLCTCPDAATAEHIARVLIEGRVAACVNTLSGVRSLYVWRGELDTTDEQLLIIKTKVAAYSALEELIRQHHPYELPEVIAVPIVRGFAAYLDWIDQSLQSIP